MVTGGAVAALTVRCMFKTCSYREFRPLGHSRTGSVFVPGCFLGAAVFQNMGLYNNYRSISDNYLFYAQNAHPLDIPHRLFETLFTGCS